MFNYNPVSEALTDAVVSALSLFWDDFRIFETGFDATEASDPALFPYVILDTRVTVESSSDPVASYLTEFNTDIYLLDIITPGENHVAQMRQMLSHVAEQLNGDRLDGLILRPGIEIREFDWFASEIARVYRDAGMRVSVGRLGIRYSIQER